MWAGNPNTGGDISLWQAGAHDSDLAAGELLQVPRDRAVAEHHHAPGRRQVGGGRAALERLLIAALHARDMAVRMHSRRRRGLAHRPQEEAGQEHSRTGVPGTAVRAAVEPEEVIALQLPWQLPSRCNQTSPPSPGHARLSAIAQTAQTRLSSRAAAHSALQTVLD